MSHTNEFSHVRACSFDCYGTLIDWEQGIADALAGWAGQHAVGLDSEELVDLFSRYESGVQQAHPTASYPQVLEMTLERIAAACGATASRPECELFAASVGNWPPFPDSAAALERLAQRFDLIVLSNVDRASFARSAALLGTEFDLVITAQDTGVYKPDPASFRALLEAVSARGLEPSQLLHVAQSLYHDHEPAKAAGLATVWIDRRHDRDGFGATPPPSGGVQPDWRFGSLIEFADAAVT
jgi:2-haloacid dehalogenase